MSKIKKRWMLNTNTLQMVINPKRRLHLNREISQNMH